MEIKFVSGNRFFLKAYEPSDMDMNKPEKMRTKRLSLSPKGLLYRKFKKLNFPAGIRKFCEKIKTRRPNYLINGDKKEIF